MEMKIVDPETGGGARLRRRRRAVLPRLLAVRGLLQGSGADRGLASTRRAGSTRATWRRRRPTETSCSAGRLKDMLKVGGENVSADRGRGLSGPHPRSISRRWSRAGRALRRRCRPRSSRLGPGLTVTEAEHHRLLPWPDRHLQGAALRPLRDRVADVRDQDPEVRAARAHRARSSRSAGSARRRRSRAAEPRPAVRQRSSPAPPFAEITWPVVKLLPFTSHETSEAISSEVPARPRVVSPISCSWKDGSTPPSPKNSVSGT